MFILFICIKLHKIQVRKIKISSISKILRIKTGNFKGECLCAENH